MTVQLFCEREHGSWTRKIAVCLRPSTCHPAIYSCVWGAAQRAMAQTLWQKCHCTNKLLQLSSCRSPCAQQVSVARPGAPTSVRARHRRQQRRARGGKVVAVDQRGGVRRVRRRQVQRGQVVAQRVAECAARWRLLVLGRCIAVLSGPRCQVCTRQKTQSQKQQASSSGWQLSNPLPSNPIVKYIDHLAMYTAAALEASAGQDSVIA